MFPPSLDFGGILSKTNLFNLLCCCSKVCVQPVELIYSTGVYLSHNKFFTHGMFNWGIACFGDKTQSITEIIIQVMDKRNDNEYKQENLHDML